MSSGTQIDFDLVAADGAAGVTGADAGGSLTDEEILGIDAPLAGNSLGGRDRDSLDAAAGRDVGRVSGAVAGEMPGWMAALAGDPKVGAEAQALWSEHQAFRAAFSSADEARVVAEDVRAMKEIFPGGAQEARALKQGTESLREAAHSIDRIDAAIFSGDVRAQSEVVTELARANPAAFRSLVAEATRVLATLPGGAPAIAGHFSQMLDPARTPSPVQAGPALHDGSGQALRKNGESWGGERWGKQNQNSIQNQNQNQNQNQIQNQNRPPSPNDGFGGPGPVADRAAQRWDRDAQAADLPNRVGDRRDNGADGWSRTADRGTAHGSPSLAERRESWAAGPGSPDTQHGAPNADRAAHHQAPQFDATAYASFERSTNDAVARDVRGSIGDTLARVLPEGVADGAAKRIGDDIFNEIHRALAADRNLSEQVAGVLHERRFGSAEQQRVISLLAERAKRLVPSVARRVVGEWTSSVLGTARMKSARQAAAASRVDIAAPGGSLDSMPLRALTSREVNYASMSDDQILGM